MTDLQKFVDLYASVGIQLVPEIRKDVGSYLTLEAQTHPSIKGYSGFVTELHFDADGKFVRQVVWE